MDGGADVEENDDGSVLPLQYDLALGVRLAAAASQARWGRAYMCVGVQPVQVRCSSRRD